MLRRVAMGSLLIVGCGRGEPPTEELTSMPREPLVQAPMAGASDGHRHLLEVDWVRFSEAQIYDEALVVIRGRVTHQHHGIHRTCPVDPRSDDCAELPLTTSRIEVRERFLDGGGDATIDIVQLGGRYPDGCWVEPNDQRLLRPGDEIVAFLKPAGMLPSDRIAAANAFSIVGGEQGLVPVEDATLDPIPETVFARYSGRPVAELARDLHAVFGTSLEGGR